jgi:hypothetical protein
LEVCATASLEDVQELVGHVGVGEEANELVGNGGALKLRAEAGEVRFELAAEGAFPFFNQT